MPRARVSEVWGNRMESDEPERDDDKLGQGSEGPEVPSLSRGDSC